MGLVERHGVWYCGMHDPEKSATTSPADAEKIRRRAAWELRVIP
jgi:hypothetical protein